MSMSFKSIGLNSAYVTSLNNFGERNLSMVPSAEMSIALSVLGFCSSSMLTLRSLWAHLNLIHPIHASSDSSISRFHQKDPLGTYACCLIYATYSHLRKTFSCFLRVLGI